MPDKISGRSHMKKVLDRWENEGRSLLENQNKQNEKAPPTERNIKNSGQQVMNRPEAVRQPREISRNLQ